MTNAQIALQVELGKRVRKLRKARGLTQPDLANLCGLHICHLSKLECGRANATIGTLVAIATNLQVSVVDLLSVQLTPKHSIGQRVFWEGQESGCSGVVRRITEPQPGNFVLWVNLFDEKGALLHDFPINDNSVSSFDERVVLTK